MKTSFLSLFIFIFVFFACETSDTDKPSSPETPIEQKTTYVLDNTNGTCAVEVYSSHLRTEDSRIVVVPAGQVSKEFDWTGSTNVSAAFFFTYKVNLTGINAFTLNYIPENGKDQIYPRIDENKKNVFAIPPLAQTIASPDDTYLSNNSYVFIQNSSFFSIDLIRGMNVLQADNFSTTGVNPGERAHYTLKSSDNRNVSVYHINENALSTSFPNNPSSFERGRIYSFIYNSGSLSLFNVYEIKLANVAIGSLDDPSNKTFVRFTNNNDFSVSVYTNFARTNKITDAPSLSQSVAVQTDPNLSGAVFYPNYNIVIEGVTIPYQGEIMISRMDAGKTAEQPNVVAIPPLDDLDMAEFEKPLVNSAYIKIQNDSIYSLSFRQGASDLIPQGTMSSIVNSGETALYIVNPGNIANYSIRRNPSTIINFPVNITQFELSKIYSFRYSGSNLVLLTEKPLTLKQAFALSPPENITARTRPSGSIVLNWNKVSAETSYKIYRTVGSPDNFTLIGSSGNTSYIDNAVTVGTTYYYKIASVKNNLESEMSVNYVSVLSEITSLSAPTGLTASVQGSDSILLSWNVVEEAVSYIIYRGLNANNINDYAGAASETSFTVRGLEINTTYYFKVIAVGEFIESNPSNIVNAKTYDYLYNVTFNSKGGSSVVSQTIERGSLVKEPANPTRSGYRFGGWYKEEACINLWNFASDTVTSNITLYAKWISSLIEMVWIEPGTFTMGSSDSQDNNASPPHQVTISKGFFLGKYVVTQEQYQAVTGVNPSYFNGGPTVSDDNWPREPATGEIQGRRPVEWISWYDTVEFCNKLSERESLTSAYTITGRSPATGYPITSATVTVNWNANGYRLPTEAEWEYACRAGTTTAYNTGNTISDNTGWYTNNSNSRTHEVGKKPSNAWGLYDIHGNVWEWCWDWYGDYASGAQINPTGAASGSNRVRRGGCWENDGRSLRSANRGSSNPNNLYSRSPGIGFRLLRP